MTDTVAADLLSAIKAKLLRPANGLGIQAAHITRFDRALEAKGITVLIYPYSVRDAEQNNSMRIDLVAYKEIAVEEEAVLELYRLGARIAAYMRDVADMLVGGATLEISKDYDIGERVEPDGNPDSAKLHVTASYITVTLTPIWLEDN